MIREPFGHPALGTFLRSRQDKIENININMSQQAISAKKQQGMYKSGAQSNGH